MKWRMDKSLSLGMPMSPQEIFKRYKRQSLGMPKASPSSSTKVLGHLLMRYIFIASYTMCYSWSVLVFVLFFFCFVRCNKRVDPSILCGRETHSVLIAKNTLVFTLIVLRVFYFSSAALSSCFSFIFVQSLLVFLV